MVRIRRRRRCTKSHKENEREKERAPDAVEKRMNFDAPIVLIDGTLMIKRMHPNGGKFVYSTMKDGWVTQYRIDGTKEKESFHGRDGVPWFTWFYVGSKGNERGVMKIYHEGDGVHPANTVEWYVGPRGHEEMYLKSKPGQRAISGHGPAPRVGCL